MFNKEKRYKKEREKLIAQLIQAKPSDLKPAIIIKSDEDLEAYLRGDLLISKSVVVENISGPNITKKDMKKTKLTERQQEILYFISDFQKEKGFSPTIRNIADAKRITVKGAYDHVNALVKKGYLIHTPKTSRSLQVIQI